MKTYLERQAENQELVEEFINELEVLRDNASYFLDYIDEDTTIEDIDHMLWEKNAFKQEVNYYSNAIEYLSQEDPSLQESIEIARKYGYNIDSDINSKLLATLLKTQRNEEEWNEVRNEVADYLDELDWSYDEE